MAWQIHVEKINDSFIYYNGSLQKGMNKNYDYFISLCFFIKKTDMHLFKAKAAILYALPESELCWTWGASE